MILRYLDWLDYVGAYRDPCLIRRDGRILVDWFENLPPWDGIDDVPYTEMT